MTPPPLRRKVPTPLLPIFLTLKLIYRLPKNSTTLFAVFAVITEILFCSIVGLVESNKTCMDFSLRFLIFAGVS